MQTHLLNFMEDAERSNERQRCHKQME